MLVITHGSYMSALQPWVQWKIEKGIDVRMVDVAEIPTVAAMDNYIANYYNSGGNDLTYLVLVGDEDEGGQLLKLGVRGVPIIEESHMERVADLCKEAHFNCQFCPIPLVL
jgi:hypothetical protein